MESISVNSTRVDNTRIDSETGGDETLGPMMSTAMSAAIPTAMPTETEIYLLPDGRVVIADMPIELTDLVNELNGGLLEDE